jgi:hypothetical protein
MRTSLPLHAETPLSKIAEEAETLRRDLLTVDDHPRAAVDIAVKTDRRTVELIATCYLEPQEHTHVASS